MSALDNNLAKKKEQNRLRQAKFYEKNKQTINEKRKQIYRECIAKMVDAGIPKEDLKVPDKPVFTHENKKIVDLSKAKTLTYNEIVKHLDLLDLKEGTLSNYKQNIKRFVEISGCDDVLKCFKRHSVIISDIKSSKKQNGEPYSNNTLKGVYQMILFLIDRFNLKINKKPYLREFDYAKQQSIDDNNNKAETKPIMKFSDYLVRVKETFGEKSKMYVVSKLYDDVTLRDDFQLLMVGKISDAKDESKNYIVMYPSKPLKLIINTYKTQSLYGVIKENISKNVSKIIRDYAKENKLKSGDYLFGKEKLTGFITTNNKKMGLSGGVSEYRHMKISEELDRPSITLQERLDLSEKMRHSPITQLKYIRKVFK